MKLKGVRIKEITKEKMLMRRLNLVDVWWWNRLVELFVAKVRSNVLAKVVDGRVDGLALWISKERGDLWFGLISVWVNDTLAHREDLVGIKVGGNALEVGGQWLVAWSVAEFSECLVCFFNELFDLVLVNSLWNRLNDLACNLLELGEVPDFSEDMTSFG